MEKYHDRMPVILDVGNFDAWLGGRPGAEALGCAPESMLREWPVAPRLNRTGVRDDDPSMVAPVAEIA